MRPVFEHRLVLRLRLFQVLLAIPGMRLYSTWWWLRSITWMVSICT
ncbi:hypothetical protein ACFOPN_13610 [Xanthomonas hyacinthi]